MKPAEFREQKAEQRAARKQVLALFTAVVSGRQPYLSLPQRRQAAKMMTDRYYAEIIRPAGKKIEQALIAEATKRMQACQPQPQPET